MSRITSNDARGLVEAYQAVYAPQELTEEQVWEEVETWVNSLLEEGYDLSDYTWEEMYEAYINEDLMGDLAANAGNIRRGLSGAYQGAMRTASNVNKSITDRIQSNNKPTMPGLPSSAAQPGGPNSNKVGSYTSRFAGNRDAEFKRVQGIKGSPVVGSKPAAAGAASASAATPARPAAAPAKPAAATPSAKPAMGPTGKPLVGGIERRTPTRAEMDAAKAARSAPPRNGFGVSAAPIAAKASVSTATASPKPAAAPAPTPAAAPAPKPSPSATGSKKPGSVFSHFDPFDVIKGHLLDEGYADTEESALAIMANMSEEWREDIIDGAIDIQEKLKKGTKGRISFTTGKDLNYDQAMTEKNPKTGRQRGTSPMYKTMGAHGRARSAQADAERSGDTEAARSNEKRRKTLAGLVYRKTGKIIDRADND